MMMQVFHRAIRNISAATILGMLVGAAGIASAAANDQKSAPKPAPAARPAAPAARPSGNSGGTSRPSSPSYNRPSGPSANRPNSPSYNRPSGPSANRPNSPSYNRPSGPSANRPNSPSYNRPSSPSAGGYGVNRPGSPSYNRSNGFAERGGGHGAGRLTPAGSHERMTANGAMIRTRSNGRLSDVRDPRRGIDVHHGLNGNRAISVERADRSRIFAERGRPGYVQHGYSFHGHDFARRTYFYHGRAYSHLYHGFAYRGAYLNVYAPAFYYRPGFYGWAYNPWAVPITYGWGWGGSPWYGYYGYYFQPYAVYPSAAFWLTDYLIAADLQTAYAAQQDAGEVDGGPSSAGGPPELTPDVKQQIANEVRDQLALENQEAQQNAQQQDIDPGSSGIARMLNDGRPHVLVVGSALDVVDSAGTECALSDGDVLALQSAPPADAAAADMVVLASKGGPECHKQAIVSVALEDLQEMQNHMRESIDQGLQDLQAKQGTGGVPAVPPSAQGQPAPAQYGAIAPPPDPNAGTEIQQQVQAGDQTEAQAAQTNP